MNVEVARGPVDSAASTYPQVKGHTSRTSVFPRGGVYMIPVSSDNRNPAGIAASDTLKVDIQLDDQPREVEVPADFAKAAKKPETRLARITQAVTMLSESKKR